MTDHACLDQTRQPKPACLPAMATAPGNVLPLQNRQLDVQRQTIKTLERRLAKITQAAVDNQNIVRQLQALAQALLAIGNPADIPSQLPALVQQHFDVPVVRLQWWGPPQLGPGGQACAQAAHPSSSAGSSPSSPPNSSPGSPLFHANGLNTLATVYCGFADLAPSLAVFAGASPMPRSVVLIPLRLDGPASPVLGVLGLGAQDKDRFAPTLETDFLQHLAQLVCAALRRCCAQGHGS